MNDYIPYQPFINTEAKKPGGRLHRFDHNAMAATFEIIICCEDENYSRQAAGAAFEELDWIEKELSRFIESSDISQINRLTPGKRMRCGLATFDCLRLSQEIRELTCGAFEIAYASNLDCLNERDDYLILHPGTVEVEVTEEGICLDLGGIGKGYAIDKMAESLREWSIESALLHGAQSSFLAFGASPRQDAWTVELRDPREPTEGLDPIPLDNRALSGSGIDPDAPHIINTVKERHADKTIAAWAIAPDAATADALSTACIVLGPRSEDAFRNSPQYAGAVVTLGDFGPGLHTFGKW